MLVLSEVKEGRFRISDGTNTITIIVCDIQQGKVRLGFEAPKAFDITRVKKEPKVSLTQLVNSRVANSVSKKAASHDNVEHEVQDSNSNPLANQR